ncbi:MAG: hypothetical protein HRU15_16550 [Planctomycetes bacterium]|nr:hypothetical protein [Planctomycetota bacterium]
MKMFLRAWATSMLLLIMAPVFCEQSEMTPGQLMLGIQSGIANYQKIDVLSVKDRVEFDCVLGDTLTTLKNGEIYDGFHFTIPQDFNGEDFLWYCNVPRNWMRWYIIPANGKVADSFKNWHNADVLYNTFDKVAEQNRGRFFQSCHGAYFTAGQQYIMWFNRHTEGAADSVRGCLTFASPEEESSWDVTSLEEALAMERLSPDVQIENLQSLGGKILLDKNLFTAGYAKSRIDSLVLALRSSRSFAGGFFISVRTYVPPCRKSPSMDDIEKKYGPAHFMRDSQEEAQVMAEQFAPKDKQGDLKEVYYYDYFGFEVMKFDPKRKVVRVLTQEDDFSQLRVTGEQPAFVHMRRKNLTVFMRDKAEVGRLYFFNESNKKVLVIQDPPKATYYAPDTELEYKGMGAWEERVYYHTGELARRLPFKDYVLHGLGTGLYVNGETRFEVSYQKGRLDGDLREYDEEGEGSKHRFFKEGKEIEIVQEIE